MPITPNTPTGPSAPNTLTPDSAGTIAAPNTLTPDSAGTIVAPNTLNADAAGTIAAPNTLSADAAGTVAVPNTLTADAVGTIAAPVTLPSVTPAALPRTLTPLVDLNFADGLYSQSGTPKSFADVLTFTRASSATFINRIVKATGGYNYFVDNALTNVLRVEYDYQTGENLGALIEGPSTNLALYSEQLDNAAWTAQDGAAVTANAIVSPDLTTSADKIDFSTNIDGIVAQSVAATASPTGTFTFSIWLKADSPQVIIIRIGNNINSQSTINVTTDWKKFEVTGTGTGSQSVSSPQLRNSSASAKTVYAWGAQYEELPFATSYIKTEGAAVSRSSDDLSLSAAGNFNPNEYSLTIDFNHKLNNNIVAYLYSINDNSVLNRIINLINVNNSLKVFSSAAGVSTTFDGGQILDDKKNTVVTTFKNNNLEGFLNGTSIGSNSVPAVQSAAMLDINIGGRYDNIENINGHISRFTTYDKALTAQEISLL
tara:strand:- start:337 stop:1791 length:1455 start_codon:yes stop_codon:yes gene_type:complete